MPKFFLPLCHGMNPGQTVTLTGDDAAHLSLSLRSKPGEQVVIGDGDGHGYLCEVTQITALSVELKVISDNIPNAEPKTPVTLFLALTKGDKFEFVVQKAVELGAVKIVPVLTSRCISRPKDSDCEKKTERWNKIALAAAKQSGRGVVPRVEAIFTFEKACKLLGSYHLPMIAYENSETPLSQVLSEHKNPPDAAIFIGPEGGFSPEEVQRCISAGAFSVSLGQRILRAETAPIAALAALAYAFGEF